MFQNIAGHSIDLLTAGELSAELHKHLGGSFHSDYIQERIKGLKLVRLPLITQTASAASFTLGEIAPGVPCGPESGYIWRISRLLVASSAGYFQRPPGDAPGAQFTAGPGAGVATPGAGAQIISLGTLPAGVYVVQWIAIVQTANATVANNFALKVGATQVAQSINAVTVGNYTQLTSTILVPAGGAAVTINAIGADATGTYNAQAIATAQTVAVGGAGDAAIVSGLYIASDQSAAQRNLVESVNITLGQAYLPGTRGLIVKSGEQVMATIQGATVGNTYTLSGIATEVPTVMQGKLID